METLVLGVIAIIALIMASYSDLKTREVPDWLSYGLLFAALGIRIIFSIESSWYIFLQGVVGFAILFTVGYIFYLVSQWGGGDAKLLMAMGAIIGFTIPLDSTSLNLLWYFLSLLLIGAVYGFIWMLVLAVKKRDQVFSLFVEKVKKYGLYHMVLAILTLLFIFLTFINSLFWPLMLLPLPIFYMFILVNVVEEVCFYRKVHPDNLTEGDWLAEDVKVNGKQYMESKTLEKADIINLRKKSVDNVLVKDGIPFIPSFLLAYLFFLFADKIWVFLLGIFS